MRAVGPTHVRCMSLIQCDLWCTYEKGNLNQCGRGLERLEPASYPQLIQRHSLGSIWCILVLDTLARCLCCPRCLLLHLILLSLSLFHLPNCHGCQHETLNTSVKTTSTLIASPGQAVIPTTTARHFLSSLRPDLP